MPGVDHQLELLTAPVQVAPASEAGADAIVVTIRGSQLIRVLFDQLVVDINPDCGPLWLDRVLGREGSGEDRARLSTALEAIAECAGVRLAAAKCAWLRKTSRIRLLLREQELAVMVQSN